MKDFPAYLKSKIFLKNLLIAMASAIGLLVLIFIALKLYTHHNRSVTVPDFSDLPVEDAARYIAQRKLRYEVFDSVFVAERDRGVVIDQHPGAGSQVKKAGKYILRSMPIHRKKWPCLTWKE